MDALRRTGVYYHFVPKVYGGLELGVGEFVEIVLPMAAACASTAWVTSFCMEHNLILSLFPAQAQEEIFGAQPYIIAPGAAFPPGRAVAVDGGFRVPGRWNYASGVDERRLGDGVDGSSSAATSPRCAGSSSRWTRSRSSTCGAWTASQRPAATTSRSTTCSCPSTARSTWRR